MSRLPSTNAEYRTKEYWDKRYQSGEEEDYDWFLKPDQVLDLVRRLAPRGNETILMLGAGNSGLTETLHSAGYRNIINVDFSQTLCDQMSARHASRPGLTWLLGDVRHLDRLEPVLTHASIDLAIDKGTMDAFLTGQESVWQVSPDLARECHAEVQGVWRLLRTGGHFLHITFAQPHFRRRLLTGDEVGEAVPWASFRQETIGRGEATFEYFAYMMTK